MASFDSEGDPTYVYCLKFCPKENSYNMLAMGSEDGVISIVDTAKRSSVKTEFTAHENAIFDIAWVPRYDDKVSLLYLWLKLLSLKVLIVLNYYLIFIQY